MSDTFAQQAYKLLWDNDQIKKVYTAGLGALGVGAVGGLAARLAQAEKGELRQQTPKDFENILLKNPGLSAERRRRLQMPSHVPATGDSNVIDLQHGEVRKVAVSLQSAINGAKRLGGGIGSFAKEMGCAAGRGALNTAREYPKTTGVLVAAPVTAAGLIGPSNIWNHPGEVAKGFGEGLGTGCDNLCWAGDHAARAGRNAVVAANNFLGFLASLSDKAPSNIKDFEENVVTPTANWAKQEVSEWTTPLETFVRGAKDHRTGERPTDSTAWRSPAMYPLGAAGLMAGAAGGYYLLDRELKKRKKRFREKSMAESRDLYDKAIAYEASQSVPQRQKLGSAPLLDACDEFTVELERYEKLATNFMEKQAVTSLTTALMAGVPTLSIMGGLMTGHRAYQHAKRDEELKATRRLLEGRGTVDETLEGFGERLLNKRQQVGLPFEVSKHAPVAMIDNIDVRG